MCCIILDGVCFSLHGMSLCRSLRLVTAFCPEGVLWLVPFGDCGWSLRFVPLLYLRFVPFGDLYFLNAFFPTIRSRRILKQPVSPLLLGLRGFIQSKKGVSKPLNSSLNLTWMSQVDRFSKENFVLSFNSISLYRSVVLKFDSSLLDDSRLFSVVGAVSLLVAGAVWCLLYANAFGSTIRSR